MQKDKIDRGEGSDPARNERVPPRNIPDDSLIIPSHRGAFISYTVQIASGNDHPASRVLRRRAERNTPPPLWQGSRGKPYHLQIIPRNHR